MVDSKRTDGRSDEYITVGELLDFIRRWKLTIGATVFAVTAFVTFQLVTRAPTFQTSATLLLEDGKESGGLLSDLATLTSAPAAEKEMAILRLRSLAEEIVRDPERWSARDAIFDHTPADDFHTEETTNLGLTTRVWSEDLYPYKGLVQRFFGGAREPHRLFATFHPDSPESVPELRVSFPAADRVRIGVPGLSLIHI